ncbi:MAG: site-specific integrase [Phycisphaerae bacterium]|nr:site-specific integrase [Phycisphaerae bacterium]
MSRQSIPKYRRQRSRAHRDRAFVDLGGKRQYLGPYDSPESHEAYHRLIAEWMARGQAPAADPNDLSIDHVIAAFWVHAEQYYRRPDGTATSELDNFRQGLRPLKQLYGSTPAADFGPKSLLAVRKKMMELDWCRTNINTQVNRLKHVFKWAVAQELVAPSVHQALACVQGLKRGRCAARESQRVKPVPEHQIEAVEPHVPRQVWALIQLQLLTAGRAGELVKLRAIDLDTAGKVWTHTPAVHKTAHHGHQRVIYFGPQAQAVLQPFLTNRPVDAYLFSPREAEADRHARARIHRRPDQKSNPRRTTRRVGEHYTTASYGRAIARACEKAFPPPQHLQPRDGQTKKAFTEDLTPEKKAELKAWWKEHRWHPHQLRHSSATFVRKQFGVEAAQLILGHAKADVTQIYAEVNHEKAIQIASRIG